jgi:hypothetical protein
MMQRRWREAAKATAYEATRVSAVRGRVLA